MWCISSADGLAKISAALSSSLGLHPPACTPGPRPGDNQPLRRNSRDCQCLDGALEVAGPQFPPPPPDSKPVSSLLTGLLLTRVVSPAVVSLRQLERTAAREREKQREAARAAEALREHQVAQLQRQLGAVERERNVCMVRVSRSTPERQTLEFCLQRYWKTATSVCSAGLRTGAGKLPQRSFFTFVLLGEKKCFFIAVLRETLRECLSAAVAELILVCPCIRVHLSWADKTSVLLLFQ